VSKPDLNALFGISDPYTVEDVEAELEPVHGDRVIATLNDDFRGLYVRMAIAEMHLTDALAHYQDIVATKIGQQIAEKIGSMGVSEAGLSVAGHTSLFANEAEFSSYMALVARHQYLYSEFWYKLRTDLETWNSVLSVRKGYAVVDLGKKFVA
jgi:hypothetical protein